MGARVCKSTIGIYAKLLTFEKAPNLPNDRDSVVRLDGLTSQNQLKLFLLSASAHSFHFKTQQIITAAKFKSTNHKRFR